MDLQTNRLTLVLLVGADAMLLDLDDIPDLVPHCREIRATVLRETKIPTCVGIGDTKTKAKLANFIAKSALHTGGVRPARSGRLR